MGLLQLDVSAEIAVPIVLCLAVGSLLLWLLKHIGAFDVIPTIVIAPPDRTKTIHIEKSENSEVL